MAGTARDVLEARTQTVGVMETRGNSGNKATACVDALLESEL